MGIKRFAQACKFTILLAHLVALVGSSTLNSHSGKQTQTQTQTQILNSYSSDQTGDHTSTQSKQQTQTQTQPQTLIATKRHDGTKQRSANDEPDEMVPLATVNNHSRNNQNLLRPPQYVDVSALMGSGTGTSISGAIGGRNISLSVGAAPAPAPAPGGTFAGQHQGGGVGSILTSSVNSIPANSLLTAKSRSGLPECATQQVCNAIFVRMNHTQRLCECSSNYNWKCSNNPDPQDGHTIELTRKFDKRIYTQIKTCEPLREVRACKSPTDWTLLALQSERSGKAHYVVVCKCPTWAQLEGPYTHNHPPYANIPGIRVYGMLCAHQTARSSSAQNSKWHECVAGGEHFRGRFFSRHNTIRI